MTVAPARSYDRSDWASSFVNVEQELTDLALTPLRGTCLLYTSDAADE